MITGALMPLSQKTDNSRINLEFMKSAKKFRSWDAIEGSRQVNEQLYRTTNTESGGLGDPVKNSRPLAINQMSTRPTMIRYSEESMLCGALWQVSPNRALDQARNGGMLCDLCQQSRHFPRGS